MTEKSQDSSKNTRRKAGKIAPEAISFGGKKLYAPVDTTAGFLQKEIDLADAKAAFDTLPDLNNTIWQGRRMAYLMRYQEAIQLFSEGILRFPDSPELYRHRGHRYLTTRQLDKAIADFQKAADLAKNRNIEVEKDGIPNAINSPLSNLHFNIYYHWALAHYLQGDFKRALELYQNCMDYAINSDLIVATSDWMYMTYRRLGTDEKTAQWEALRFVNENMKIVENQSYYERCLLYKGIKKPEDLMNLDDLNPSNTTYSLDLITKGYGIANWYFYNGNTEKAVAIFQKIVATDNWSAFGFIAAEAELAR